MLSDHPGWRVDRNSCPAVEARRRDLPDSRRRTCRGHALGEVPPVLLVMAPSLEYLEISEAHLL